MVAKILAGVALFFALTAIILKSVALSVPHFVDVHLVIDPEDANDGNRLGGVGVFQSEFNSDLEGDIADDIAAANIPIINIETPSLEFPLLFPSQENFFATVLPINRAALAVLDESVTDAEADLGPSIDAVNNLALNGDDCTAFADDVETAVFGFFNALQGEVIPNAVVAISIQLPIDVFDRIFPAIQAIPSTIVTIQQGAALQVFANDALVTGLQASPFCAGPGVTLSDALVIDADGRGCLTALFEGANEQAVLQGADPSPVIAFIALLVASEVACPDASNFTVAACIAANENKYLLVDTPIGDTVEFVDNAPPNACAEGLLGVNCFSKGDFLQAAQGFFAVLAQGNALFVPLVEGITAYNNFALTQNFVDIGTFAAKFDEWPETSVALAGINGLLNKDAIYQPCDVIRPLLPLGNITDCDSFEDYLVALPVLLADDEDLGPTVASIAGLYASLFASEAGAAIALVAAPQFAFTPGLIGAGFNTDFENTLDPTAEIIQECSDDVEDNEKIAQAQALAVASTLFEAVALLLIIVGIILPVEKLAYLAPAGAIAGILGGVFILTALFVVESAPVYDAVGATGDGAADPDAEPEVFFIQGYVPLLALVDAVLFFLSGVVLIAATVFACKEGGEAGDVEDIKADAPMEDKI